jgi:hypothetical protein
MPTPSIYANGQDLEALGLRVATVKGPWDLPAITDPAVVVPYRLGRARTNGARAMAPRTIAITGTIFESAGVRTNSDFEAKVETIKALLAYGLLEVRFANQSSRAYTASLVSFAVDTVGPSLIAVAGTFDASFACEDPLGYELVPDCVAFGATPTPVPVASGPSAGLIRIMGPATNPTIKYRRASGEVAHTIALTRSLLLTDYEEIDLDAQTITRVQSGTRTNDVAALTSGDIEAFAASPADGDRASSLWPTLECTGLGAGGGCEYQYTRTHL